MNAHKESVLALSQKIVTFHQNKAPFWIYHGSTNCTRTTSLSPSQIIDTSSLIRILSLNASTITLEPNIPMDRLVEFTLRYNLIPPVVPEFPGITVGGAFSGTAGESSSFKHGFFDRSVKSVEMILADGEVVKASRDDNRDLFYGAAGAYGTLGVLTLFEIQLVPAKKFVELKYIPCGSSEDALEVLKRCRDEQGKDIDFLDGIVFSKTESVVCVGKLTNKSEARPQHFSGPWDPWFYMHALEQFGKGTREEPTIDTIPIVDYLFRYDRGAFWMGKYYPLFLFNFLNNTYTRWLSDSFLKTRFLFQSMHLSNRSQKFVIQDLMLPSDTAGEFISYIDKEFEIYPLWICPLAKSPDVITHRMRDSDMAINIGVWGSGPPVYSNFLEKNKQLEKKLRDLGGLKWLYAHTYYTESDFWKIYNKEEYEEVRRKYKAETLPTVYEKVKSVEVELPKQDFKASVLGALGCAFGYDVEYLLSGRKSKID